MPTTTIKRTPIRSAVRDITYRQRAGSDTWHWLCPVARRPRPTDRVIVDVRRPKGDLCNQCRMREGRS